LMRSHPSSGGGEYNHFLDFIESAAASRLYATSENLLRFVFDSSTQKPPSLRENTFRPPT
jgi:hypothetical protein